jgi:predicted O-linked N-acetylglucosamine transferase (SPINDLY family)
LVKAVTGGWLLSSIDADAMPQTNAITMLRQLLASYINTASAANARGEFGTAKEWCGHALQRAPDLPEAWYHLGLASAGLKNRPEAVKAFEKARTLTLQSADAQNAIGVQLIELGAYPEAEKCLLRSVELAPGYAFAVSNLGKLRDRQGRLDEAETHFRKAIELQPDLAPLHANLGGLLIARKDFSGAHAACQRSVELDPNLPDGWRNLGIALGELKRFPQAEAACRTAIERDPAAPEGWSNLGNLLSDVRRFDEAEAAYRKALALDPHSAETWSNLGNALSEMKQFEAATECFQKCRDLNPGLDYSLGNQIAARMRVCDWSGHGSEMSDLLDGIRGGSKAAKPFDVLALTTDPALQRQAAEIWCRDRWPDGNLPAATGGKPAGDRITLGYFSADFFDHATAQLMVHFFERQDRSRFELIAFSFGPDRHDAMTERLSRVFDQSIDVRSMSDAEVAQLAHRLGVDIAVDLKGYTQDSRPGIFAHRAAPVQVSYLGYPGTMGAGWMDYLIADECLIPQTSRCHYTEKIVYLPDSYQVNDGGRRIAETVFTRSDMGLPETGFVFCCFNNNYKITPQTFDGWMRILGQVEGSVLWLLEDNSAASAHLRAEAERRRIGRDRLVFAGRMPAAEHLARHRLADLCLDTLPYNAHTTASDALWAGLPVLTCRGPSFASRVAASLLHAVGLPELVTDRQDDFERLAVELATQPARLASVKDKLARNRLSMPLFDTGLFTRHLEDAFVAMVERHRSGLAPDHLHVPRGLVAPLTTTSASAG